MYKKLVALFMAMIMTFGASLTAFANTVRNCRKIKCTI